MKYMVYLELQDQLKHSRTSMTAVLVSCIFYRYGSRRTRDFNANQTLPYSRPDAAYIYFEAVYACISIQHRHLIQALNIVQTMAMRFYGLSCRLWPSVIPEDACSPSANINSMIHLKKFGIRSLGLEWYPISWLSIDSSSLREHRLRNRSRILQFRDRWSLFRQSKDMWHDLAVLSSRQVARKRLKKWRRTEPHLSIWQLELPAIGRYSLGWVSSLQTRPAHLTSYTSASVGSLL